MEFFAENCYILVPENSSKALIVDPGYGAKEPVQKLLAENSWEVGAVLLTHGHPDHIWDAAAVASDKPVYIPAPDRYRLDQPFGTEESLISQMSKLLPAWEKPNKIIALGDEHIASSFEIIPDLALRMLPAPGHSEGSALFFLESPKEYTGGASKQIQELIEAEKTEMNLLALCGDVIFSGSVGRTDLPGGDQQQMLHTLRTLQNCVDPATLLLPGHGEITTFGREKRTNPYLAQARYQG